MSFNRDDLYALSSGVSIFGYWQPFVTKHDTSSFYSWEVDNLPLYDLEERTHYLYEKFGYPLSAVPSVALLVSASVPTESSLSANVFTSLSAAVESLPEILRAPYLIEVAVSGAIGELNLNNIKCEDDGLLEIVNRGFAPFKPSENDAWVEDGTTPDATYYFNDTIEASALLDTIDNTSALSFSANTADLFTADGVAGGFTRSIYYPVVDSSGGAGNPTRTSFAFAGAAKSGGAATFRSGEQLNLSPISPASWTSDYDDATIQGTDLSTISDINSAIQYKRTKPIVGQRIAGWVTANKLDKIQVEHADGPVFIRGFIVDGYDVGDDVVTTDVGIKVFNSNNVTLEYCGAMRCKEGGIDVKNSNVNLRRGAGTVRCYDAANRPGTTTFGIRAQNSNLSATTDTRTSGIDFVFVSQFQDVGVELHNSKLVGGDPVTTNTTSSTWFEVGYNGVGVKAVNSEVSLDGTLDVFNNGVNVEGHGSIFDLDRLVCENAQKEGVLLNHGSKLRHNKNKFASFSLTTPAVAESITSTYPTHFVLNGQHLKVLGGSEYGPTQVSSMPTFYKGELFLSTHGAAGDLSSAQARSLPSILVDNSKVELVSAKLINSSPSIAGPVPGINVQVNHGGLLVLRGTGSNVAYGPTVIQGPSSFLAQSKTAGIAALNGSKVFVHGPTSIYNQGICLLAQKGSSITCSPHRDPDNTTLDASSWILGQKDHTAVEMHATKACVVADDNSEISFEDCGDWNTIWEPNSVALGVTYSAPDYPSESEYTQAIHTSAGCIQFYPNAFENNIAVPDLETISVATTFAPNSPTASLVAFDSSTSSLRLIYTGSYIGAGTEIRRFSTGGMCVRAAKNSNVLVRNVNFPMGHVAADGSFLDPSASLAGCNDLLIWNLLDNSRLNASYCGVSGVYPSLAGYTGPRSTYFSGDTGQGWDGSAVAYGFSGVDDTSTLSVLDHFGSGVEVSANVIDAFMQALGDKRTAITATDSYGPSSYENRGPFRLYFSVPSVAKTFGYLSSTGGNVTMNENDNRPAQHLAQGYNLSGAVSGIAELSSIYADMLVYNPALNSGELTTSGFHQMSSLMEDVDANQVMLDESASNTWANAKHCSTKYSGRKRLVKIHRATTSVHGEGHTPDGSDATLSGLGMGFRSSNIFDLGRDV